MTISDSSGCCGPGRWRPRAWLFGLAGALAGCTVGPYFAPPAAPALDRVTTAPLPAHTVGARTPIGGGAQDLNPGRDIPGAWWALFHAPRISALVAEALKANPDLAAARVTLREALENRRAEQGAVFPSLSASGSATRETTAAAGASGAGGSNPPLTLYSGSLSVSYTFDAFGGIRRQVEALGAEADYDRYELEATQLSLTANVVTAALTEAGLQARIDATREIIRLYQDETAVTQRRFDLGGVSWADVLSQQSNLASARATLPPLQKQMEQERNQLAVYLGVAPSQAQGPVLDLATVTLPADLPVSLPSRLVEQRPDIKAYEALLHAATAKLGIATANMLPQITLSGSYGGTGNSLSNLFSPSGLIWSLAGMISQPVFDGGTLLHKRRAAEAAVGVAAAQYSSTVNTAFQNVADALVAVQRDAETLGADVDYVHAAADSLAVSRSQYAAGGIPYVSLLQAEQTWQNARLTLVAAQTTRFTDTVALFQALGGGWWNRTDVEASLSPCCGVLP